MNVDQRFMVKPSKKTSFHQEILLQNAFSPPLPPVPPANMKQCLWNNILINDILYNIYNNIYIYNV